MKLIVLINVSYSYVLVICNLGFHCDISIQVFDVFRSYSPSDPFPRPSWSPPSTAFIFPFPFGDPKKFHLQNHGVRAWVPVVVWMRNVPPKILSTWTCGPQVVVLWGGVALLEDVHHWGDLQRLRLLSASCWQFEMWVLSFLLQPPCLPVAIFSVRRNPKPK